MDPVTMGIIAKNVVPSTKSVPGIGHGATEKAANGFGELLGQAMDTVNNAQKEADTAITRLASGEPVDLHQVMIAMERADLTAQLATEVRDKLVEAYQEIMRMQV